jgi:hypothetical protein
VINGVLRDTILGLDAMAVGAATQAMARGIRNSGRHGIAALAISAVDIALWDLKAKLLDLPLARLLDPLRDRVPVYGSGGFVSWPDGAVRDQLAGWVEQGIAAVKMKIGAEPRRDPKRVALVRRAIGDAALFVDANGAFTPKQALRLAYELAEHRVSYFEEPVPSADVGGLRWIRDRAPPGMDIAAGEYSWDLQDTRRLLEARAVDVVRRTRRGAAESPGSSRRPRWRRRSALPARGYTTVTPDVEDPPPPIRGSKPRGPNALPGGNESRARSIRRALEGQLWPRPGACSMDATASPCPPPGGSSERRRPGARLVDSKTVHDIVVDVPIRTAYNQWTQFEEFPNFMPGVQKVTQKGDDLVHFEISVAGHSVEYDARILEQVPDQRIAWESVAGDETGGVVTFQQITPVQTKVALILRYAPKDAAEKLGDALGVVSMQAKTGLNNFKEYVESRGAETGSWRGKIHND